MPGLERVLPPRKRKEKPKHPKIVQAKKKHKTTNITPVFGSDGLPLIPSLEEILPNIMKGRKKGKQNGRKYQRQTTEPKTKQKYNT